MPHFQKLYEKFKNREDVLILTLNIDENVGLIAPFLKKNNYTFPVLPAKFYVESLNIGQNVGLGIPQQWLVNASGVLKLLGMGFGAGEKWVEQMAEAIEKARPTG